MSEQETMNYRFLFPDYNTMYELPLVIFLHGSDERGDDNISTLFVSVHFSLFEKKYNIFSLYIIIILPYLFVYMKI